MHSQASHVRERSRMVFRVAGLCAALATALLIAAVAGAQDPLAQEGKDLQDQATGTGQSLLPQIVFSSTRDNLAPSFEGSGCDLIGSSTMPTFNYLRCQNQNQRELYLMNLDGTDPVRLTTNTHGDTT